MTISESTYLLSTIQKSVVNKDPDVSEARISIQFAAALASTIV